MVSKLYMTYIIQYQVKDHLGSNCMVVNSIGTINQHNIYYALGGNTALSSGQEYQQYKYTDKEYDPMHGLNQYDFSNDSIACLGETFMSNPYAGIIA